MGDDVDARVQVLEDALVQLQVAWEALGMPRDMEFRVVHNKVYNKVYSSESKETWSIGLSQFTQNDGHVEFAAANKPGGVKECFDILRPTLGHLARGGAVATRWGEAR